MTIYTDGEFGYELILVVPYANWLTSKGTSYKSISSIDTKCFYFFNENHEEKFTSRVSCLGSHSLPGIGWNKLHTPSPNFSKWIPPDYKKQYAKKIDLINNKPLMVITNKRYDPPGRQEQGTFSDDKLIQLFEKLSDRYEIIYSRPKSDYIVEDTQKFNQSNSDFNIALKYGIKDINNLYNDYRNVMTFNTFQCALYANCDNFISVQGGSSILASYFGGRNLIFASGGKEIEVGSYKWYHNLSGCDVDYRSDFKSFINLVQDHYV